MEHLKYCIAEILAAKELLAIPNSSFFSRSIARFVAVRTDDFIKAAFRVNKAHGSSRKIKDDLNALQELYKNYLAEQRNKFGAHFQDLDFAKRIGCWQDIDYERSTFFIDMPLSIYEHFSSMPDYQPISSLIMPLSEELKDGITGHNQDSDLERYPTISVDSLALARFNTGGILPGSTTQWKAASLKAIEIIVKYNIGLLQKVKGNVIYEDLVKKMLITDVVSYADNFITRIDLSPGSPQDEKGLDSLVQGNDFKTADLVIREFLSKYRFHQNLVGYREIRNKCCGHIDVSYSVTDLQAALHTTDEDELIRFYRQLKETFYEVCSRDFLLQMFRIEPGERIRDAIGMTGLSDLRSFDGAPFKSAGPVTTDVNDEEEYKRQFVLYKSHGDEESRRYFYDCFARSEMVEKSMMTFGDETYHHYRDIEIRKAHLFFKDLLTDTIVSVEDKESILRLFSSAGYGYPNALLRITLDTYIANSTDKNLNASYLHTIGDLCHNINIEVRDLLKQNLQARTYRELYNAIMALFKIDIFELRNNDMRITSTAWSPLIFPAIQKLRPHFRCVMSLGLLSQLYFNTKFSHLEQKLKVCYLARLEAILCGFVDIELAQYNKKDSDRREIRRIKACINVRRYATFCGLLGDFFEKKKNADLALFFRAALHEKYVMFSYADYGELHNYAAVCHKLKDFATAIAVAEDIVTHNPWDTDKRFNLLCFYLADPVYSEKFDLEKKYLLENFHYSDKFKQEVAKLAYN